MAEDQMKAGTKSKVSSLWLTRLTLLPLLLALLLAVSGCNSTSGPPEFEQPLTAGKSDPNYVLTVPLVAEDTVESVERDSGADVLVWRQGKFAVLGFSETPSLELQSGRLATLADDQEADDAVFAAGGEMAWMSGTSTMWAGGVSSVWAGGVSTLWADGTSVLWADGEYQWLPENTPLWQHVHLDEGHALATNLGLGVKVAVIDTGVDLEHPALVKGLAPAEEWWDFYADDPSPQEEGELGIGAYGHGTIIAGIVRQVAPRATILPLRVLGPEGKGDVADLAAAVTWAVDKGADVINLSMGSAGTSAAVEAAISDANSKGVFVVASTGNTGDRAVTYPASSAMTNGYADWRLSVGSVDRTDAKSSFSTFDKSAVEMAAPGENVYGPAPGERLAAWSGTSMAAPMAAGALALALGESTKAAKSTLAEELHKNGYYLYDGNNNSRYKNELGKNRLDFAIYLKYLFGLK